MLCLAQGSVAEPPTQHPSNQEDNLSSVKSLSSRSGYNKLNHRHFNPNLAMHQSSTSKGLVFRSDMAQGIPLRAASIDGVVSISAVQWLCYLPNPRPALARLFRDLHRCLKPGCKAVLQVYLAGQLEKHSIACLRIPLHSIASAQHSVLLATPVVLLSNCTAWHCSARYRTA